MNCGSSVDCHWVCPGCPRLPLRQHTDEHGHEYDLDLLDLINDFHNRNHH